MYLVITGEPLFPRHQKCNHIFLSSVVIKFLTFDLDSVHLLKTAQPVFPFLSLHLVFFLPSVIYVQYECREQC